jgi:hypothetical protein
VRPPYALDCHESRKGRKTQVNVREWWDTIVLRDVLGYLFPGAMTLFALMLLAANLQWKTSHELVYDE